MKRLVTSRFHGSAGPLTLTTSILILAFSSTIQGYQISGTVYEFPSCIGYFRGATVRLDPPGTTTSTSLSDGSFSFSGVGSGQYTVSVLTGNPYGAFLPINVNVSADDVTGLQICPVANPTNTHTPSRTPTPTPTSRCIGYPYQCEHDPSGFIYDIETNQGIPGVMVEVVSGCQLVTEAAGVTDASGHYRFHFAGACGHSGSNVIFRAVHPDYIPDECIDHTNTGGDVSGCDIGLHAQYTPTPTPVCEDPAFLSVDPVTYYWSQPVQTIRGETGLYVNLTVTGGQSPAFEFAYNSFEVDVPLNPGLNELTVTATRDFPPFCTTSTRYDKNGGLLDIFYSPDNDSDGIPDLVEGDNPPPAGKTNRYLGDSDGDGFLDGEEDTNLNGSHEPGELNPRSADTDSDHYEDGIEAMAGGDAHNPLSPGGFTDFDQDRLPASLDDEENEPDQDGDRYLDGYEACQLGLPSVSDPQTRYPLGDTNGVGFPDNADAQLILNFFANLPAGSGFDSSLSDVNRDAFVDNADSQRVLNFFGNMDPYLPRLE